MPKRKIIKLRKGEKMFVNDKALERHYDSVFYGLVGTLTALSALFIWLGLV